MRFFIRTDLRCKHDVETRKRAAELFERGLGCREISSRLSVPRDTVKERLRVFHMPIECRQQAKADKRIFKNITLLSVLFQPLNCINSIKGPPKRALKNLGRGGWI